MEFKISLSDFTKKAFVDLRWVYAIGDSMYVKQTMNIYLNSLSVLLAESAATL